MSSAFPKSESTTSLLRHTAATRRPAHVPDRPAEHRRTQHQHHYRPKSEESCSAESDASSRRPLCHPFLFGPQDADDRGPSKSPAPPHHQLPDPPEPNGEVARCVRERCRSSKPPHRHHRHHHHHHRRRHHPEDNHPPAEPELPRRTDLHPRPVHRVPSLPDNNDDRAPLCEPQDRKGTSPSESGRGQVSSPAPSSRSLVPLSSRSSRRSRRSSTASSASDINLRTILNSLFGQVRHTVPLNQRRPGGPRPPEPDPNPL